MPYVDCSGICGTTKKDVKICVKKMFYYFLEFFNLLSLLFLLVPWVNRAY